MAEPLHEKYQTSEIEGLIAEIPITEPQHFGLEELQSFISQQFQSLTSRRSLKESLETEQNIVRDQYREIIDELNTISRKIETGSAEQFNKNLLKEQKKSLEKQKEELKTRFKSLENEVLSCIRLIEQQESDLMEQVNQPLGESVIKNLSKREQKLQNQFLYLWDVKRFFEQNKIEILKSWGVQGTGEVQVHLELLGQETHHGGKSPVKITFQENAMELLTLVYKPRKADTDIAILALFRHLNGLPEGQKTGPDLPHYKVENLGEGSIWQYIEGKTVCEEEGRFSAAEYLQNKPSEIGKRNLERLEQICSAAGITDLNGENIKATKNDQWILVDLEVVEQEKRTGLYELFTYPKPLPLSDKERELKNQFVKEQEDRFSRFVPISTYDMLNLMNGPDPALAITKKLQECLSDDGYQIRISPENLQTYVDQDVMNEDVPFLSKKGNLIYYDDEIIAEKER